MLFSVLVELIHCLQEVQPNSPADLAGLKSNTDYVIGADSVLHEVRQLSRLLFCNTNKLHFEYIHLTKIMNMMKEWYFF